MASYLCSRTRICRWSIALSSTVNTWHTIVSRRDWSLVLVLLSLVTSYPSYQIVLAPRGEVAAFVSFDTIMSHSFDSLY